MKITLTAVDNHGVSYPYETTAEQLVAENERLRAENAALKTEARTRDAEHASLLEAQIKRLEREYQEAQNGFNDHVALCKQLQAENAELRERCQAIAADADNWKRLACTSDRDLGKPVAGEMDAAEREHWERGKDITGCDV